METATPRYSRSGPGLVVDRKLAGKGLGKAVGEIETLGAGKGGGALCSPAVRDLRQQLVDLGNDLERIGHV